MNNEELKTMIPKELSALLVTEGKNKQIIKGVLEK